MSSGECWICRPVSLADFVQPVTEATQLAVMADHNRRGLTRHLQCKTRKEGGSNTMEAAFTVLHCGTGAMDAEAEEKEMQQAALAALAAAAEGADSAEATVARPPPVPSKHKLSAELPAAALAAAAAAGQHLDGEAVEEKTVHDDKSAAQKLSEQIVEQGKLGAAGLEAATAAEQTVDEGQAVEQAQVVEQVEARPDEQAKTAEQANAAEQAKAVEQAKAAEQAQADQQAQAKPVDESRLAGQAQSDEQAKAADQAHAVGRTQDGLPEQNAGQVQAINEVQAAEQAAVLEPLQVLTSQQQQTDAITSDKLLQLQLASQSQQAQTS